MAKCQVCGAAPSEWSWQPFGPDDLPYTFATPGAHYRGFPVVKVCESCRQLIRRGESVTFTYRKQDYHIGADKEEQTPAKSQKAQMTDAAKRARAQHGSIKQFAQALGVSPSKAGMICQGRYLMVMTPDELRQIARALDLTPKEASRVLADSYRQWAGVEAYLGAYPLDA